MKTQTELEFLKDLEQQSRKLEAPFGITSTLQMRIRWIEKKVEQECGECGYETEHVF